MELKAGSRWASLVSQVEIMVVRAPDAPLQLACGGTAMVPVPVTQPRDVASAPEGSTLVGKRYIDDGSGLEVLGTKGGPGALSAGGRAMRVKEAKALPSSD